MLSVITLSAIAAATVFALSNAPSAEDKLFMENMAALADPGDPIDWEEAYDDTSGEGGGSGNKTIITGATTFDSWFDSWGCFIQKSTTEISCRSGGNDYCTSGPQVLTTRICPN